MFKFKFINPIDFPDKFEPNVEYTTKIVRIEQRFTISTIWLEYIGAIYNPKDPQCLFPVYDDPNYYVHPFMD